MGQFKIVKPSVSLQAFVKHYWILETDKNSNVSERIIPTGNVQLIFHRGKRMFSSASGNLQHRSFISGLTKEFTDLYTFGKVNMIVVVFYPLGAKMFFAHPLNLFHRGDVSVEEIGDRPLAVLHDHISNEEDNTKCINLIEQYLQEKLNDAAYYNMKRILPAIHSINTSCQVNVLQLAENACLSYKQFNRIFTEQVGANPKEFFRIVRFQRSLFILQKRPDILLTQLAYDAGYYDQSHLIKDFKLFSGYTPGEYLQICPAYSDYFSQT